MPRAVSWGVDYIGFNISITTVEIVASNLSAIIVLCAARHILTNDPFTSQLNRKQREGMTARLDLPYPGFPCKRSCSHSMHCHWMCDVAGIVAIPVLVADLLPGQRYSCSVSAENENGLSLSSSITITSTTDLCRGLGASPSGSVVHIIYAVDRNSLTMFAASAISLLQSAKCQNMLLKLHIALIDVDLVDFSVLFNVSFAHVRWKLDVVVWDVPPEIANVKIRMKNRQDLASPANYARFYVGRLFPHVSKFIYVDNDVIFARPVELLWQTELGENVAGLVHECGNRFYTHVVSSSTYNLTHPLVQHTFGTRQQLQAIRCFPNAGVMIMNQTKWSLIKGEQNIETLISLNRKKFIFLLGSQPLLVLTVWGQYKSLGPSWNVRYGKLKGQLQSEHAVHISIAHFNGSPAKKALMAPKSAQLGKQLKYLVDRWKQNVKHWCTTIEPNSKNSMLTLSVYNASCFSVS